MRRRTFLKLSAGSTMAVGVATAGYFAAPLVVHAGDPSQAARTHVLLSQPTPSAGQPLTLRQAWQLSLHQGQAWSADATIVGLRSLDQSKAGASVEHADAGADGRRAVWQATLVAPSKPSAQLQVQIDNGVPVQSVVEPRTAMQPPLARAPALDSPAVVAAMRSGQLPLAPGSGKSRGYSFTLGVGSSGQATLAVIGNVRGMPAKVDFDATSGKEIGTSVYWFSSGGILYSADAGQSWHASSLTGEQVQQIAAVPGQPGSAYAVGLTFRATLAAAPSVPISKTTDGGRTWNHVGTLPDTAGLWANDLAVASSVNGGITLAVAALSGLWLSRDDGISWAHDASLPTGAVQWVAAMATAGGSTFLATIANLSSPEHAGVYASKDGGNWQRLLPISCRLSSVDNGHAVMALADDGSTTGHLIGGSTATPLTLPIPALRAAGAVAAGKPLLIGSAMALALSLDAGQSWSTTMRRTTTGIAVAPPGNGGSSALAAGFRTGIFRSSNGGRTWRQVVSSVSSILPGSDEVTSLTFLSPSDVVAAQGGFQTWQPV